MAYLYQRPAEDPGDLRASKLDMTAINFLAGRLVGQTLTDTPDPDAVLNALVEGRVINARAGDVALSTSETGRDWRDAYLRRITVKARHCLWRRQTVDYSQWSARDFDRVLDEATSWSSVRDLVERELILDRSYRPTCRQVVSRHWEAVADIFGCVMIAANDPRRAVREPEPASGALDRSGRIVTP